MSVPKPPPGARVLVFWPSAILLIWLIVVSEGVDAGEWGAWFLSTTQAGAAWLGWLYAWVAMGLTTALILVILTPLGDLRLGGREARPRFSSFSVYAMALGALLTAAALYWSAAEPARHIYAPPAPFIEEPNRQLRGLLGLAETYRHWALTPWALCGATAVVFALYQHQGGWVSIGAALQRRGGRGRAWLAEIIDMIAAAGLAVGAAVSLCAALSLVNAGAAMLFGLPLTREFLFWSIGIFAVAMALTAATGLLRGTRLLSVSTARLMLALGLFVFLLGPTDALWHAGWTAFKGFIRDFFRMGLYAGLQPGDPWSAVWTTTGRMFWMAWAPAAGVFLGWLAYGFTVRGFLLVAIIGPMLTMILWLMVFGGFALHLELTAPEQIAGPAGSYGDQNAIYAVLRALPLHQATTLALLALAALGALSATAAALFALGALTMGEDPRREGERLKSEAHAYVLLWGLGIGAAAFFMAQSLHRDTLSALPAAIGVISLAVAVGVFVALVRAILWPPSAPRAEAPEAPASPSADDLAALEKELAAKEGGSSSA